MVRVRRRIRQLIQIGTDHHCTRYELKSDYLIESCVRQAREPAN